MGNPTFIIQKKHTVNFRNYSKLEVAFKEDGDFALYYYYYNNRRLLPLIYR